MTLPLRICLLYVWFSTGTVTAQDFRLMRYDEVYVQPDTLHRFYQQLKFIPLSPDRRVYLSVGGEARMEYASFRHEDWGRTGIGKNRFVLQRYALHADLHLSKRFRVFAQLRSALENGRKNGPRPIDEDQLNLQNLFADVQLFKHSTGNLRIRVGRQELDYGSGRLISVMEGPNVRLYFTGLKLLYMYRQLALDGFVMMADTIYAGVFDNRGSQQANLWSLYSRTAFRSQRYLEGYYIGINRTQSVFEEGSKPEVRHTVGARLSRSGDGLNYNMEAAWQFGRFGNGPIRAWTASLDISYRFAAMKVKHQLGLKHDYISGDRQRDDGHLETFNPLYPKGGYFGFDPQIGPANLIDVHPYGSLQFQAKFRLEWDVVFNWRYSLNDGIYRPSGLFNLAGCGASERYIGTGYLGKLLYEISPLLSAEFGVQYFHSGPFIRSKVSHAENARFVHTRMVFRF